MAKKTVSQTVCLFVMAITIVIVALVPYPFVKLMVCGFAGAFIAQEIVPDKLIVHFLAGLFGGTTIFVFMVMATHNVFDESFDWISFAIGLTAIPWCIPGIVIAILTGHVRSLLGRTEPQAISSEVK